MKTHYLLFLLWGLAGVFLIINHFAAENRRRDAEASKKSSALN